MNKKITRRAVLGTTIATLAAGPFVMRAWRKTKDINNGVAFSDPEEMKYLLRHGYSRMQGDFYEEWRTHYGKFDAVFEKDDAVGSVVLNMDFSPSRNWRFRHLSTRMFGKDSSSLSDCTPANLTAFNISEGMISTGGGVLNVLVNRHEEKRWGIDEDAIQKNGMKIVETVTQLADGTETVTMTVEKKGSGSSIVNKVHENQLETGSFSVMGKNNDGQFRPIDKNGREIVSEDGYEKSKFPILLANDMLSLLMYPFLENSQLEVGCATDIAPKGTDLTGLPKTFVLDGTGDVNNVRVARLTSEGQVKQNLASTTHRTLDMCVDLDTGLLILRKDSMFTKRSGNGTDSINVSVFQIS